MLCTINNIIISIDLFVFIVFSNLLCVFLLSQAFLVYAGGLFANSGNYKGFGDTKFIPNLSKESFESIVKASKAYENDSTHIAKLWENTKDAMYNIAPRLTSLGLSDKVSEDSFISFNGHSFDNNIKLKKKEKKVS